MGELGVRVLPIDPDESFEAAASERGYLVVRGGSGPAKERSFVAAREELEWRLAIPLTAYASNPQLKIGVTGQKDSPPAPLQRAGATPVASTLDLVAKALAGRPGRTPHA
jgi:hypothetical protein